MMPRRVAYTGHAGLKLAGDAWGDAHSPPVIMLHGGGQTRHAWGGTARALAEDGWFAVSLDLRGHGDSEWAAEGDYSIESFAGDAIAVAKTFGRPPVVVGASLGGMSALVAAGESEESPFAAVILVDVAPRLEPEGVERIISFMSARPDGFVSLQEAADCIADYLPHRPRPRDLGGLEKNLRRGRDGRYRWHWDPRFVSGDRRRSSARDPDRMTRAARNLRVPALLVRGGISDLVSVDAAREFLRMAPNARYVDVSGAGHMVAGDRNDAFTAAVIQFLRELRAAA